MESILCPALPSFARFFLGCCFIVPFSTPACVPCLFRWTHDDARLTRLLRTALLRTACVCTALLHAHAPRCPRRAGGDCDLWLAAAVRRRRAGERGRGARRARRAQGAAPLRAHRLGLGGRNCGAVGAVLQRAAGRLPRTPGRPRDRPARAPKLGRAVLRRRRQGPLLGIHRGEGRGRAGRAARATKRCRRCRSRCWCKRGGRRFGEAHGHF